MTDDHDLLVVVHTKLERVLEDLKDMRLDTMGRIAVLEANKLDKAEAMKMMEEALAESTEKHNDFEMRIRFIERYMWLAIGALGVIQAILNYLK